MNKQSEKCIKSFPCDNLCFKMMALEQKWKSDCATDFICPNKFMATPSANKNHMA